MPSAIKLFGAAVRNTWQRTPLELRQPAYTSRVWGFCEQASTTYPPQSASSLEEEGLLQSYPNDNEQPYGAQEIDSEGSGKAGWRVQATSRIPSGHRQSSTLCRLQAKLACIFDPARVPQGFRPLASLLNLATLPVYVITCICLHVYWPRPTSIHFYLSAVAGLLWWTIVQWTLLIYEALTTVSPASQVSLGIPKPKFHRGSPSYRLSLGIASALMLVICLGRPASPDPLPPLLPSDPKSPERYFIAANLYNSQGIFKQWSTQLVLLCEHRKCKRGCILKVDIPDRLSKSTSRNRERLHFYRRIQQQRQY